jgi:hypothetical protein
MMMKTQSKAKHEEGGTPTHGGPKGGTKQKDDSQKPAKVLGKESVAKSEKTNMTGKKGYNETPPTVPVKSTKQ